MFSHSWLDYNYLFNAAAEPMLFIYLSTEKEDGLSETAKLSDRA